MQEIKARIISRTQNDGLPEIKDKSQFPPGFRDNKKMSLLLETHINNVFIEQLKRAKKASVLLQILKQYYQFAIGAKNTEIKELEYSNIDEGIKHSTQNRNYLKRALVRVLFILDHIHTNDWVVKYEFDHYSGNDLLMLLEENAFEILEASEESDNDEKIRNIKKTEIMNRLISRGMGISPQLYQLIQQTLITYAENESQVTNLKNMLDKLFNTKVTNLEKPNDDYLFLYVFHLFFNNSKFDPANPNQIKKYTDKPDPLILEKELEEFEINIDHVNSEIFLSLFGDLLIHGHNDSVPSSKETLKQSTRNTNLYKRLQNNNRWFEGAVGAIWENSISAVWLKKMWKKEIDTKN